VWRKLHDWVMELERAHLRNQAAHDCIGAQLEEAAATYSQASDMFERTKVTPDSEKVSRRPILFDPIRFKKAAAIGLERLPPIYRRP